MQSLEHLNTPKKPDIQLSTTQKKTVKYLTPFYKQGAKWFNLLTGKEEKKNKKKLDVFTCPETDDLTGTCHKCGKELNYHDSDYQCLTKKGGK